MSQFRPFEAEVLKVLVSGHLAEDRLAKILDSAELVSYEYTGSGYFLTVQHSSLPARRVVCSKPLVLGRAGEVQCGFVVFLENAELTLECHTWGPIDVPKDFRDHGVEISVAA